MTCTVWIDLALDIFVVCQSLTQPGVWDQNNPIGSYVHAHTNLTEIKDSMSLLWRNDVAPEKVVLGTGFYGRSFQLNDTSCDTSGCPFAGAANKGECTGEGGILGYFGKHERISTVVVLLGSL